MYISRDHLRFVLHEYLGAPERLRNYSYYEGYDAEAFDMAIDAALQIGDQYLHPIYAVMDREKATCKDGVVKTHPQLQVGIEALAEGGWISAHAPAEVDGQQMPLVLNNTGSLVFMSANGNVAAYAFLTVGASNLILAYGSDELKQQYLPSMYSGRFQGTMALTEPQAGSSLSDITTTARPLGNGRYAITGQKIYISGGDHPGVDNVVHLLLARIEGAPAGTRGISLFVVPKHRPTDDGAWEPNDVLTAGIYGKMGQKGYVAAHLMFGEQEDCIGYLVGEEHRGLPYMFSMMNEARIGTGIMATGTASAAYYASLQYAKERPQGRHPSQKDATQPQVPIIEHADVRRMLLMQKSVVEGAIALLLESSLWADLHEQDPEGEGAEAHLLLELLTPIIKTFPSEYGTLAVMNGMQVLGGAGYTDDFPLEQYYRDIRVNAIYEGTTGIHGLDLLGRKVLMHEGKALHALSARIVGDVQANAPHFPHEARALGSAVKQLGDVTTNLMERLQAEGPDKFLADATLYLEQFGLVVIAWHWLRMAGRAEAARADDKAMLSRTFYESNIATMRYFIEYELPKAQGLATRLLSKAPGALEVDPQLLV